MKHHIAHLFLLLLSSPGCIAAGPLPIPWSDKSYGPDGPWHAVTIALGSPQQAIDLYPGGSWGSGILLSTICRNASLSSICYADRAGGLFNSDLSSSWDNTSIQLSLMNTDRTIQPMGVANEVPLYGKVVRAFDELNIADFSIPDVTLNAFSDVYQVYPGGKAYQVEMGVLSLGCSDMKQSFTGNRTIETTFTPSYLYEYGAIPSYSYGMHIGSVPLGIPGSLVLGGYDQNRVLGDVSAQPYSSGNLPIDLLDVKIGVISGGSPWTYTDKTGLLGHGNASINYGVTVFASGADPYIYLPHSTCEAIAAELPVTHHPDYGLYFWNTEDKRYSEIVSAPTYLGFTFSKNSLNNANITINIPFSLLNLTLDAPLVDKPTPYFPCMGTNGNYVLGRAFMQAAFVGVNWGPHQGSWFLAQAPGPNIPGTTTVTTINPSDNTVKSSSSDWESSWKGVWKELPATSAANTSTPTPSEDSCGLSTGAKTGITIAVAVAAAVVAVFAMWRWLRGRRQPMLAAVPKQERNQEQLVYELDNMERTQVCELS
ncbi:hypothetical protein BDV32DRAFT_145984 [Aspergillus pseudonomiae]|nr:hypothetical protein BDV32DRAFT_145984 [Aspergillus pseudonomiae]